MISFAQKTYVQGTLTSKLHVIELGAAPGGPELLQGCRHLAQSAARRLPLQLYPH